VERCALADVGLRKIGWRALWHTFRSHLAARAPLAASALVLRLGGTIRRIAAIR
jgi:hypothetical protein